MEQDAVQRAVWRRRTFLKHLQRQSMDSPFPFSSTSHLSPLFSHIIRLPFNKKRSKRFIDRKWINSFTLWNSISQEVQGTAARRKVGGNYFYYSMLSSFVPHPFFETQCFEIKCECVGFFLAFSHQHMYQGHYSGTIGQYIFLHPQYWVLCRTQFKRHISSCYFLHYNDSFWKQ